MSSASALASVTDTTACFDTFRQKLYIRGVLGKKNDRAADGRPYSMRKWTRWYVELRGPVLVFWNLLDTQLSAYLEDITAIVDGRVRLGSPEFERTVGHIKNIVLKPNFINITDAACSIVGKLKKRDSVWTLHSSGANRFFMQAVDDRAMNEWVRALRLACFEAAKLYEYYTASLIAERYPATLLAQRPTEYHVQVRFAGTNDWVPCLMALTAGPTQISFSSEDDAAPRVILASIKSARAAYCIYPDCLDLVDTAVIAKLEGDCEIDPSLLPRLEDADGDGEAPAVTSRTHGAYALVIFQSPPDMMSALVEAANNAKLYNAPASFLPDFLPTRDANLYLSVVDIADKSIEIMEPVTARRMMDNLASERCPKLDVAAGYSSTSGSTANMDVPGGPGVLLSRKPWDSDESADELTPTPPPANGHTRRTGKLTKKPEPEAGVEAEDDEEEQPQKRHFRFLHKSGKTKDSAKRDSTATPSAVVPKESNGKHIKRQSKTSSSATASSAKESLRTSASESLSHSSTAPSLPTPVSGTAARGASFVDEASAAISNLKLVESPPPVSSNVMQLSARQLAESDTESDSDAPLGNIVARGGVTPGAMAHSIALQQQQQMMMQRASTVGGAGMLGHNPMMAMQQQQQQQQPPQGMVPPMIQHTQSMYGANMNPQMMPMQQPQSMYVQDPNQLMAMQQNMMMPGGGVPMPFQGGARPNTYMDPNGGNMWGQQQQMGMGMGMGMGMDSVGGPLLTVEKKADPIERPTGLVGAIANREQMKSEQKYRDSSSLMKERQMRRNQAMGMNSAVFANPHLQQQMGGARFGGGGAFPNMYGGQQGWNDDNMSMMSGMSGRAPYAQIAPSLSAEQLAGPYNMRTATMYGGAPMMAANGGMNGQMAMMAGAHDEDDVALSVYAGGGGRMSMAVPNDVHPLRAAMQSGMSSSTPHLAGTMNQYSMQQMQQQMQLQQHLQQQQQLQALQLQQQQAAMYGAADQQRRISAAHMQQAGTLPRSNTGNATSPGSTPFNAVNSRQSLASTNSGGSHSSSSGSSPLAMNSRGAAASGSRWVKDSGAGARSQASTMPRPRGANGGSSARANISSVYELPGRSGRTEVSFASSTKQPSQPAAKYGARFTMVAPGNSDGSGDSEDDGSDGDGMPAKKMSKELRQYFDVFVEKCLDVKPYAWLEFETAFSAYKNFCSRNGLRGKEAANSSQFQDLMNAAEWQLKTKESGVKAYYNTCLI
ncbi:hypothetical protein IW152_002391 [Coemansia sp. BCRC 34962]|nr:hypothetical protein IW152_002391 [Coemansia sp. BCRC 34962]